MDKDSDFRILLVGRTGHGKSSTGNSIIGQDFFEVSGASTSKTKTCKWSGKHKNFGKTVEVVDTPGLFDTDLDQLKVHKELLKALALTTPGFHVIAFVLMKGKFTEEIQKTQDLFFKWFGKNVEQFACIILTDTDNDEDKDTYIKDDPHPKLLELLQLCHGNIVALNNRNNQTKHNQIQELFEVVDRIKRKNDGLHFSNVIFQVVTSYIESKCPNKLTNDTVWIIDRINYTQLSYDQIEMLQQMLAMYKDDESEALETYEDPTARDGSDLGESDVDFEFHCTRSMGNLQIYDSQSNTRIQNKQLPRANMRNDERRTRSGDIASPNRKQIRDSCVLRRSETDEVPGKSSDDVGGNFMHNYMDDKEHSVYQIESDDNSAEIQGSTEFGSDDQTYCAKRGRPRQNRKIDVNSFSATFDDQRSSPINTFKERVNNNEMIEEELKGMLGFFKKAWKYCKRKVSSCILI